MNTCASWIAKAALIVAVTAAPAFGQIGIYIGLLRRYSAMRSRPRPRLRPERRLLELDEQQLRLGRWSRAAPTLRRRLLDPPSLRSLRPRLANARGALGP